MLRLDFPKFNFRFAICFSFTSRRHRNSNFDSRFSSFTSVLPKIQLPFLEFSHLCSDVPENPILILDFPHLRLDVPKFQLRYPIFLMYQLYTLVTRYFPSRIKWRGDQANHLPFSAPVFNEHVELYSNPPIHFRIVVFNAAWDFLTFNFVLLLIIANNWSSYSFIFVLYCFLSHYFFFLGYVQIRTYLPSHSLI
jgi:hypothetical protein